MSNEVGVYEWGKEYHKNRINIGSIWEVCNWARLMSKLRLDKDVSDPIYRAVIGLYQLSDLERLKNKHGRHYSKAEVSEAAASSIFHIIAAMEMTGVDVASYLITEYKVYDSWILLKNTINKAVEYDYINLEKVLLLCAADFQRQVLYFSMNRTNRFNKEKARIAGVNFIEFLIRYLKHNNWDLVLGLSLCMSKLQSQELNNH